MIWHKLNQRIQSSTNMNCHLWYHKLTWIHLIATIAFLSLFLPKQAQAVLPYGSVCTKPGVCSDSVAFQTFNGSAPFFDVSFTGSCGFHTATQVGAVNVYVIWYQNPSGVTWTASDQSLILTFLQSLNTSFMQNLTSYPNNPSSSQTPYATSLNIQIPCTTHCYTDPETEGTVFNGGTGLNVTGTDSVIIGNAITGGHLPFDPNGIYYILPATDDITFSPGPAPGIAWHVLTNPSGANNWTNLVMVTNSTVATSPISQAIGGIAYYDTVHETVESISNACNGWVSAITCAAGFEIADICVAGCGTEGYGSPYGSQVFVGPSNTFANYTFSFMSTTYYVYMPTIWHNSQGGYCDTVNWPQFTNVPCRRNSDCPAWSGHCSNTQGLHSAPLAFSLPPQCAPPSCIDGIQNAAESDVDCGVYCFGLGYLGVGALCPAGKKCNNAFDCVGSTQAGCVGGICQQGPTGANCYTGADCISGTCNSGTCA